MINPSWLITFKTLVEVGHFTKAADKLFMTQPGVSQHISKLEQACGHTLIRREKKSFEVTEQGHLVFTYAQQLLQNEAQLLESMNFDDPFSGHYSIASSGALALQLYPKLLNLQITHPMLTVNYKAAPNHQILEEIQHGVIDIGIVTFIPNPSLFDVEDLGQESLCLVLPANLEQYHGKLNSKEALQIPEVLSNLGLINHPDAEQYLSLYLAQCGENTLTTLNFNDIKTSGYVNQISQILEPVARGLGFSVLPQSAVDSFAEQHKLKVFEPKTKVIETCYLVNKRNRVLPARFTVIKESLRKHFNQ